MEYLSNIELYFSEQFLDDAQKFILIDEEYQHCVKVMRNKIHDKLYATDGCGTIFEGIILAIEKGSVTAIINKKYNYENRLQNFIFCVPNLKNPERLRFALEKCTELGITKFILYNSEHTVRKRFNVDRLNKIVLSGMKQSLRAFLPDIKIANSIKELKNILGEIILFDQLSPVKFGFQNFDKSKNYLMIFGPEGGFTENEISDLNSTITVKVTDNRLRSETSIIAAATLIAQDSTG